MTLWFTASPWDQLSLHLIYLAFVLVNWVETVLEHPVPQPLYFLSLFTSPACLHCVDWTTDVSTRFIQSPSQCWRTKKIRWPRIVTDYLHIYIYFIIRYILVNKDARQHWTVAVVTGFKCTRYRLRVCWCFLIYKKVCPLLY